MYILKNKYTEKSGFLFFPAGLKETG